MLARSLPMFRRCDWHHARGAVKFSGSPRFLVTARRRAEFHLPRRCVAA
jgi:hypothetical protein